MHEHNRRRAGAAVERGIVNKLYAPAILEG